MARSKEGVRSSGVSSIKGRRRRSRRSFRRSVRGEDNSKEANSEDMFALAEELVVQLNNFDKRFRRPHNKTPPQRNLTENTQQLRSSILMTGLDYVDIPACATVVPPDVKNHPDAKVHASLPPSSQSTDDPPSPSPTRSVFGNLPSLLLTSSLQIPTNPFNENPRNVSQLLSTRDHLSIPITTVNFRRFIGKIGPIFWLQDRIEEIVTWRKGWKVTMMWMIAYSFLCELGSS